MPIFPGLLSRRRFIGAVGVGASASAVATVRSKLPISGENRHFRSDWQRQVDRVWVGPEYWANPLQDWAIQQGHLVTTYIRPDCNIHLLTHQLSCRRGEFECKVTLGPVGGNYRGSAGFLLGVQGPLQEFRNNLMNHAGGIGAGMTAEGRLFINDVTMPVSLPDAGITLKLQAIPQARDYRLTLTAYPQDSDKAIESLSVTAISADQLQGNVALATNFTERSTAKNKEFHKFDNRKAYHFENDPQAYERAYGLYWFSEWELAGSKLEHHQEQTFGPILFSQYTLSRGILKLTAQMPPIGQGDNQHVELQVLTRNKWHTVTDAVVDKDALCARFRVKNWNEHENTRYRLSYLMQYTDGSRQPYYWEGTVQKDPVDKTRVSVADISCNTHEAFPNAHYAYNVARLQPDLIAFVGDQFYESSGGYAITTSPPDRSILDFLRRWYMHGWTWRELTRDVPSVCLPDDHDVLQGNIWGMGGRVGKQKKGAFDNDDESGYEMPARWVNVVHRVHSSHHPDPYDSKPSIDGMHNYYGELLYGGISFAILADRMYKSGPREFAPPTKNLRADHVTDPQFDPATADTKGAKLLGDKQLEFIKKWAADWKGADLKAVISQTIFTSMATTHGPERTRLVADYDSNGWPQTPRNAALREIRKAFAFHIAGDQHLPALVQYGIDEHRDCVFGFAGPAVNVGYPRWFEPEQKGKDPVNELLSYTGDFSDNFGNDMTVVAYANGAVKPRNNSPLTHMQDKASGIGMVTFDKQAATVTVDCWPYLADPKTDKQFAGWPVTLNVTDNYNPRHSLELPTIIVAGIRKPVVQIIAEDNNEVVYTLRLSSRKFPPQVFKPGNYSILVTEPETGKEKKLTGIRAAQSSDEVITIQL